MKRRRELVIVRRMAHAFRFSVSVAVTGLLSAFVSAAATPVQQGAFPPARVVNLQVLPKDSTPAAVINVMKQLTQALGVRCDHCHVGTDGQPLTSFDFVSDAKKAKATARAMMRLVEQVNASLDKAVPGQGTARVTCITCHNGSTTPRR